MALSGELKDFGLLQLLTLVQVTGKTGALTLQRPGESATVYFENGELTGVSTGDSRSGGLATSLHRAGKIDRDQYEQIASQAPPSEKAVALLLEDQGSLSREEIADFVRQQALTDLYSLLTWAEGNFRMDLNTPSPEEDIAVSIDLGPVLEKGRGYLEEWQLLTSYIPDLDRPLRLMPQIRGPQEEVRLGAVEWRMVATMAADAPLKDVGRRLGLDEFAVRQVAYRLIHAGLAEMAEPEVAPPAYFPEPREREEEQPRPGGFSRLFGGRKR